MYKTLGFKWLLKVFCPASAFVTADRYEARNPQRFIHVTVMRQLKQSNLHTMKTLKISIIILTLCLHTNLFADIAPNPIKAKSISPKEQTSIRMESEKVIIDLYNDSSVVKCLFNMKNLGEQEKIQIGFPEMTFHYLRQKSKVDVYFGLIVPLFSVKPCHYNS